MPEKKPEYPYTSPEELRALRKRKKEELVAIICYLTKRLGVNENAVKGIIAAHAEADSPDDYFQRFTGTVKKLFETTMKLMKSYNEIIPDIVAEPRVVVYQMRAPSCEENCTECPACQEEEERPAPQYDPSDITVQ